jgi:DNA repair protein RecO (recombination protein O)
MPLDQAEAIVLRTSPLGDQDKLGVFLTRDKGLIRGIAKGARKFGNRFGSSLEPMSHVTVFYYEKERKDLVTVSNCDLVESFFDIQKDLKTSLTLSYFSELIEEFIPIRAQEDIVFRLLLAVLQALKENGDLFALTRYFEAWLLQINGYLPDVRHCKKCRKLIAESGSSGWLSPKKDGAYCDACTPSKKDEIREALERFLSWVRKNPPPRGEVTSFSEAELKSVGRNLQTMIVYHLEREPKSLRYIKD